jgi:hypothetical protein
VLRNFQVVLQTVALSWKTHIKGKPLKLPGRATAWGQRGCCAPVFRVGGGKIEVFYLPGFGVLLAGIALYNVHECVPAVKISPGPMDDYVVKLFTHTLLSLL